MNVGFLIGGVVGLVVVAPVVVLLFSPVVRLARDAHRYVDDILENGVSITADLDPVPALISTKDLIHEATSRAARYVGMLEKLL